MTDNSVRLTIVGNSNLRRPMLAWDVFFKDTVQRRWRRTIGATPSHKNIDYGQPLMLERLPLDDSQTLPARLSVIVRGDIWETRLPDLAIPTACADRNDT